MNLSEVHAAIRSEEVVSGKIGSAHVEGRIAYLVEGYRGSPKVVLETDQQGPPRTPWLDPGQTYVRYSHLVRGSMPAGFRNSGT